MKNTKRKTAITTPHNTSDDFVTEDTDETGNSYRYDCNNELHSLHSPAAEYIDGTKVWYQNDKRHRLDGPAIEYEDGSKSWYQNDNMHRIDGPAIELSNGYKAWYIKGKFIGDSKSGFTETDFENYKEKNNYKITEGNPK